MQYHDEDVKIASSRPSRDIDAQREQAALGREYVEQKESGNLDLSGSLGALLARQVAAFAPQGEHPLQQKVLFAFSAVSALEAHLNRLCKIAALSEFYNTLINLDREFYDKLDEAFSFYYLTLRKGMEVENGIGRNFAMLCGKETDETLISQGSALYGSYTNDFVDQIEQAELNE